MDGGCSWAYPGMFPGLESQDSVVCDANNLDLKEVTEIIQGEDFPKAVWDDTGPKRVIVFPKKTAILRLNRAFLHRNSLMSISNIQGLGVPVFADASVHLRFDGEVIDEETMDLAELYLYFRYAPYMLSFLTTTPHTVREFENACTRKGVKAVRPIRAKCSLEDGSWREMLE